MICCTADSTYDEREDLDFYLNGQSMLLPSAVDMRWWANNSNLKGTSRQTSVLPPSGWLGSLLGWNCEKATTSPHGGSLLEGAEMELSAENSSPEPFQRGVQSRSTCRLKTKGSPFQPNRGQLFTHKHKPHGLMVTNLQLQPSLAGGSLAQAVEPVVQQPKG